MPSLRQIDFSIPRLLGYMSEQAIYMVNSFQFTRSARFKVSGGGIFHFPKQPSFKAGRGGNFAKKPIVIL